MEKKFKAGDIIYWHRQIHNIHVVSYGIVNEIYPGIAYVDMLEPKECRTVNGIPIDEFESDQRWRKLPKGWTWNTQLYEVKFEPKPEDVEAFETLDITNPEQIKALFEQGLLVKADTKFHGKIDVEISKDGYKVVKTYPRDSMPIVHTSVPLYKGYSTYEEAQKEVDDYYKELDRISKLTDLEWSIESIKNDVDRLSLCGYTPDEKQQYLDWLLALDDLEHVETRISLGRIQWKYEKNSRWRDIEL